MGNRTLVKSVAVIGAGAAGAATAAALAAEAYFDTIRIFERRETSGGTWIYDADPGPSMPINPGKIPPEVDPSLSLPQELPAQLEHIAQYRYETTPIYAELTTNVPDIIMSFSDERFAYGPFAPHWIPKQYIQNYLASHRLDGLLALNTTVEEARGIDVWWEEQFDAVVIANGHYSVPFIPEVRGLEQYIPRYPGRVTHSKAYRTTDQYINKSVLIIGNSASGHDITTQLVESGVVKGSVYQSRRTHSRWDGKEPPAGIVWKPIIREFDYATGDIIFEDDSVLQDIDAVIYCTGYKPSFPFWNIKANGRSLFNYKENKLIDFFQHTFSTNFPNSLAIVGIPRVLTFRSFEYQAVAIARLFSGRNAMPLPSTTDMKGWDRDRSKLTKSEHRPFHGILWDNGETMEWFQYLYEFSGLPLLEGKGRVPPVLDEKARWAYNHLKKYPEPDQESEKVVEDDWIVMGRYKKDSAHFI